jgi:hypothetical protein
MGEQGRDQLAAELEQFELGRSGRLLDDFGKAAELPRKAGMLLPQFHELGHKIVLSAIIITRVG